ncbi:S8 family serine peptidase [Enemella sp. A6]|uniref:S8 family serine peptidase n=1 Tax=Enemella sp. A6 TaxID=3440152 RepID=UPI003EBF351A
MSFGKRARARLCAGLLAGAVGSGVLLAPPLQAHAIEPGEPYDTKMCRDWASEPAGKSWQVERMKPEQAWSRNQGEGVTIAVIDTGVDTDGVPMLEGADVTTVNFTGFEFREKNEGMDDCAHGTSVVGLIVGQPDTDPNTNMVGIAPRAKVIAMRTLQVSVWDPEEGEPELEPLEPTIAAIEEAVRLKVDIINISQQGSDTPAYRAAIKKAIDNDIVVIAAAGNKGSSSELPYPAAYPGVIAVGMSGPGDLPNELSQWHRDLRVSVAAPAVEIPVVRPSGSEYGAAYALESGTSFAAPQVTGTVALMLSDNPDLTPDEVQARLELTADPPPMAVPDKQLGYGIVNPQRAVTGVVPRDPEPPASPPPGTPAPDPDDRVRPDTTMRNVALALSGAGVLGLGLAAALVLSAPSGRKRRWRPAAPRDDH